MDISLNWILLILIIPTFGSYTYPETDFTDNPKVLVSPGNTIFESSFYFNQLSWTAVDSDPSHYFGFVDGQRMYNGTWESGVPFGFNFDEFDVGSYRVLVEIYDEAGHKTNDEITIDIVDTTPPTITRPSDKSFSEGSIFNFIRWVPLDPHPGVYEIRLDGNPFQDGIWVSTQGISIIVDDLELGTHEFIIDVWDAYDNMVSDTVMVEIFTFP